MKLFVLLPAAFLLAFFSGFPFANAANEKEAEVKSILERLESDVLAFRDEMERVRGVRCNTSTLDECAGSNYNDCASTFPGQQCMKENELVISECGDGVTCNALWDKDTSTVSIPDALATGEFGNPRDPELIESVCYSRLAEEYLVQKYKNDEDFWLRYNVQPSWTYFGAHNGLFRKIPATHQQQCGQYDPRLRPWYVAASSGPKDVVLVIDTSGSMDNHGRMAIAKEAAVTIVDTLTVADRVAVVPFSGTAAMIGSSDSLVRATRENKKALVAGIKSLEAGGATNFYDALNTAFSAIDRTIFDESSTGCNVAILFLTDGKISEGPGADSVIALVNERTERLATAFDRYTTLFTYSLGHQADHDVVKRIACSTNGIWTPVDDLSGDLVTAMSSYYKLYALGLGEGGNEDFTAWVEPYEFANPAGKLGTTVSAPVYDRSVSPPLFLGVVAIDIYTDALEEVLGEDAASSAMLERFVMLSTARCPRISLTECELDALRFLGGGEASTCGVCNSTNYAGIVPEKCPAISDLPNNLWHNTELEGKTYERRACCEVDGGTAPSDSCAYDDDVSDLAALVGIVVACVVACCCIGGCCYCCVKKWQKGSQHGAQNVHIHFGAQSSTNAAPGAVPATAAPPMANNYNTASMAMPPVAAVPYNPSATAPPANPVYVPGR